MLKVLDLFSGIGGFSLGLERTGGFETVAFCEIEDFPRNVLAKHWPEVPCYEDVRELTAARLAADGIAVDVICGGFPCQDISFAGRGAGLAGERSGLFYEIARLVGELEPRYVILENVAALLSRGLGDVLGTLASLGYDAEWHCIPASYVGAPHRRDRIWIIAYRQGDAFGANSNSAGPHRAALHITGIPAEFRDEQICEFGSLGKDVAHTNVTRLEGRGDASDKRRSVAARHPWEGCWWFTEPNVGRVAHGVPDRTHRLKVLGNAVVPQIPELIGHAILDVRKDTSGNQSDGFSFISHTQEVTDGR